MDFKHIVCVWDFLNKQILKSPSLYARCPHLNILSCFVYFGLDYIYTYDDNSL